MSFKFNPFTGTLDNVVSVHNTLSGKQGGTTDEYYHLTATEHPYVSGANAQSVLTTASPAFAGLTIDTNALYVDSTNHVVNVGSSSATNAKFTIDNQVNSKANILEIINSNGNTALAFVNSTNQGLFDNVNNASLPRISFSGDTDTGIFRGGSDVLAFATGGVERGSFEAGGDFVVDTDTLYVDASNDRVGINQSTPLSILHLGTATEELEIVDAGSTSATEQDWIEVEVGGNVGYIRVYATK